MSLESDLSCLSVSELKALARHHELPIPDNVESRDFYVLLLTQHQHQMELKNLAEKELQRAEKERMERGSITGRSSMGVSEVSRRNEGEVIDSGSGSSSSTRSHSRSGSNVHASSRPSSDTPSPPLSDGYVTVSREEGEVANHYGEGEGHDEHRDMADTALAAAAAAALASESARNEVGGMYGYGEEGHGRGSGMEGDGDSEEDEEFLRSPAVQRITTFLQNFALFDYLERHTSVPRVYWLMLLLIALSIAIFCWVGVLAVCNFICFVYPAYRTYKTLEGRGLSPSEFRRIDDDESIEVHRFWLSYWVVYGLFRVFEFVGDYTLYWLPYYDLAKIVFLVWCFHPSSQGCAFVYRHAIRPLFLPREQKIDEIIAKLTSAFSQAFREVKGLIVRKVAKRIAGQGAKADDTPRKLE